LYIFHIFPPPEGGISQSRHRGGKRETRHILETISGKRKEKREEKNMKSKKNQQNAIWQNKDMDGRS
jgi:hypothetical protein